LSLTPPEQVPQKPKRQYKKKVAVSEPVAPAQSNIRLDTELIDTPPSSPEPRVSSRTKKPRTEKQVEAFNKMREARLKKTEELKHLKEIEKHQRQLEKEEKKLETLNDKIVEKATAIKQRKSRKHVAESFDVLPEPQYIPQIQETKHKAILFV
jgi:DNA gyrase/topoisomerase IV subunit A